MGDEACDIVDGCMEGRREILGSGRRPHGEVAGVAWLSQGRVEPVRVLVLAPRVVEATGLGGEVPIVAHHPDAVGHEVDEGRAWFLEDGVRALRAVCAHVDVGVRHLLDLRPKAPLLEVTHVHVGFEVAHGPRSGPVCGRSDGTGEVAKQALLELVRVRNPPRHPRVLANGGR